MHSDSVASYCTETIEEPLGFIVSLRVNGLENVKRDEVAWCRLLYILNAGSSFCQWPSRYDLYVAIACVVWAGLVTYYFFF